MKPAKDLKNNEINNNTKPGYLIKERPFDHATGQRKENLPFADLRQRSENGKSETKKAKDSQRSSSIELSDFQQPLFEPLNSANEEVELQKLISSIKDGSTSDGTMSRKQSVVSQDSNKYGKRKISTVLELKDYKWTEEQESTSISSAEKINFKKLKQLEASFAASEDADQAKRKKRLQNTERNRTWALISMMAFLILSMVICSNYLEKDLKFKNSLEYRIVFRDKELRTFDLLDDSGRSVLTVHYGLKIPKDIKPVKCSKLSKGGESCGCSQT